MKELMSLGVTIVIFIACSQQTTRYTQQSPEIETYKQVLEDYEDRDWDAMVAHYADTAKIMNNVTEEEGKNLTQFLAENKKDASQFSSWDFVDDASEYEMIVNDEGETWVNFWGLWEGTYKTNNKVYQIPTHITARFVNGKIVREFGYWDVSKIIKDIQQGNELSSSEERTGN
ncbi:nuclear transport factor 2 family protein [Salegentibacter sp. BDJ18]|uniref:nuclear transport factor 2 family protein n=1 Tax=Salegentibacter sp. BDJ18 TaxID=2816376 RepID=UPI001AAFB0E0|nr:nuclear transport factor 2 family protein [Salegentibacter sp. BDJ18]MBO2543663.1 nuclear transport factor 2 family protein [Salegentibacter sp. BDJ18]